MWVGLAWLLNIEKQMRGRRYPKFEMRFLHCKALCV